MWTLWQDLRYSLRLLAKHPGFTLTAVGVLALGIGVNAGIFGIINGLLIRPLAGADAPGEVVGIFGKDRTTERGYRAFSYPGFEDVRDAKGPFAAVAAHNVALGGVTEHGATRQSMIDIVSTNYFATLGVRPMLGRDFTLNEERPGSTDRSVIISYKYWERLQFDPDVLSKTVRLNGQDYGIIGVAPERFSGTTAIIGTEFFVPLGVHDLFENDFASRDQLPISDRRNQSLLIVARLEPAITREQANEQLKIIAAAHEQAYPVENKNQDLLARPLSRLSISTAPQDDRQLWAPFVILQGLAASVLLISCLNLANMMLAFGATRQKEIAIRLAVGSSRSRIVRQLLVQGMALALAGGVAGLIAASWASTALVAGMSTVLPFAITFDVSTDYRVVLATFTFCALATIGSGLWPALRLTRPDLASSMKDQAGEISGHIAGRVTVRGALVTTQLALSLALLVLSGLFVRSAVAGTSANPGFAIEPLVVAEIDPRLGGYDVSQSQHARRAVLERLRSTPGIEVATAASVLPFGDYSVTADVQRAGPRLRQEDPAARGKLAYPQEYIIGADYFRALGLTMLRGREFTFAEELGASATSPVIIDAALADRLFPKEDPVGQILQFGADSHGPDAKPMEIIGVAPPLKHDLFTREPEPHIYLPAGGSQSTRMFVYARAAAPRHGDAIVEDVREQLRAVDADMPVSYVRSFRSQHESSAQIWLLRSGAKLFLTLGLAAAFVAVVGLYGVRSYLVSRRTREFGVRMAIGAAPADVMRLVLREAAWTTSVGLAIGLVLGALLGMLVSPVIYEVRSFDPLTLAGAAVLLTVASFIASVVPARRAASVLPMTALRND
jgi:predicted permease